MQRTIGFDFGTHQTKICIEEADNNIKQYKFFSFSDTKGNIQYMLPSVVRIKPDNTLDYGYTKDDTGTIIRYFKQASFCADDFVWKHSINPDYFSIWYIAYILFLLEEEYSNDYATQMGAPTDTANLEKNRHKAVSLMLSAIHLVEDVFNNDLDSFLHSPIEELQSITEIIPYSKERKNEFSILVFPEAYACLRPLTTRGKISSGMSLMVDIGGGTTDISFFTLEGKNPQIYKFFSIPQGLNYLTGIDSSDKLLHSNIIPSTDIAELRIVSFCNNITLKVHALEKELEKIFQMECSLPLQNMYDALKSRPIIYTGGGSMYSALRKQHRLFSEIRQVTLSDWEHTGFADIAAFEAICPILTTAYGLSISSSNDDIAITPLSQIFIGLRGVEEEPHLSIDNTPDYRYLQKEYGVMHFSNKSYGKKKKKQIVYDKKFIRQKLAWYKNYPMPISDNMISFYAQYIEKAEVKTYFFDECKKWNEQYAQQYGIRKRKIYSAEEVQKKLDWYVEHNSPIGKQIQKDIIEHIEDEKLEHYFIEECRKWNENCRAKKKDLIEKKDTAIQLQQSVKLPENNKSTSKKKKRKRINESDKNRARSLSEDKLHVGKQQLQDASKPQPIKEDNSTPAQNKQQVSQKTAPALKETTNKKETSQKEEPINPLLQMFQAAGNKLGLNTLGANIKISKLKK